MENACPRLRRQGSFSCVVPHQGACACRKQREAELVQVAFWTSEEGRAYALSGTVVDYHDVVASAGTVLRVESQVSDHTTAPTTALVGLRAAHEGHQVGASLPALRRASSRPGFPDPIEVFGDENLYDLDELREWERNRVRPREAITT